MQDDKFSFCMNSLSLVLKSKVLYVTNCRKIVFDVEVEENKLVCLSEDSIIILFSGLESRERKISYHKIQNVDVDLNDEKIIRIVVMKTEKNNYHISLSMENREEFINNLKNYFEIYSIKESGKFKELIKNFVFISENKKEIISNTMSHYLPANYIISSFNNYIFYIKKGFTKLEDNLYIYSKIKNSTQSSKLILDISTEQPIEKLSSDDEYDIAYSSNKKYKNYMKNNFKFKKYSTLLNTAYIKTSNLNGDKCQWEGWRIKSRTGLDKNSLGFNLIFLFLRRKFIPPFCETYQDITTIILEEYSILDEDFEVSQQSLEIIENLAGSIIPKNIQSQNKDCIELIKMKMDKFLMDRSSYEYFINNLTIIGESSYKLGLDITLKLLLIIEKCSKDFAIKIKKRFLKKIKLAHKLFPDKDYEPESYVRNIKKVDFPEIFQASDENFKFFFPKSSQKDFDMWDSKRWNFLVYCLNGGLSFNLMSLETIISVYKRKEELTDLNWLINKMLNIRIINFLDEILPPNITTAINNLSQIKYFSFNEEVMASLIENNILAKVQGIDSEYVYTQFLNFLITKHSSNKILLSVYFYLKLINKKTKIKIHVKGIINELNSDANENEYNLYESDSFSLKNKLKILLESFLKIYAQNNLCPIILSIACKCLNILANFESSNKITLLNSSCLGIISEYLISPDEKLLFTSLQLLINLLMDTTENIKTILEKNPKIFKRCLKIIKRPQVVGIYFSTKTLILVFNIILILIKTPTAKVKEELCKVEYKNFAKYFLNYLLNNQKTIDEDLSHPIPLQEKVVDLLYILINRNFDYRNYLQDNFKMVELLDQKFEFFCIYSNILLKTGNKGNSSLSNDTFEEYIKFMFVLMKFLKRFISNDLNIMHKVRINCVNIMNGIIIIKGNRQMEFLRILVEVADDLFIVLYGEDKINLEI